MATKRQQTMAKMARERTVREKRERKMEKKRVAKEERRARAAGELLPGDENAVDGETVLEGEPEPSTETAEN